MAIPDYQRIMLPLLEFVADEKEHSIREAIEYISKRFELSEEEKRKLLLSGQQAIIDNRVGWARTYLMKAGLLESSRRGYLRVTTRGLDVLKEKPPEINRKYLERFQEFREFITLKQDKKEISQQEIEQYAQQTPQESLEYVYQKIQRDLAHELLNQIKKCSSKFFEKLVIDLLLKMGYGGSRKAAGEAIGQSGDEGIDGIIKEDKLGLDVIYIQAKRWDKVPVGRPEIQKFVGALQGQKAKKGIFITTSNFSKDAVDYISRIDTKIVLIDGEQLAQLMIDNDIGVSEVTTYEIKKIDSDYFSEE